MIRVNFRRGGAFASKKAKRYLESISPEDVKKIAVIRHAAIGDWVATRPFLIKLREVFPNAYITLSVDSNATYGMPEDLVDSVHFVDKHYRDNKNKKTGLLYRIRQAKKLPPQDIVFDLTDSTLSVLVVLFANANLKIGYPFRWIRRLFFDMAVMRSQYTFESYSHLDMLGLMNVHTMDIPLQYNLTKKKRNISDPYIVYFAGASVKSRCWSEENYAELIGKMCAKYPTYKHIVLKGIKEDESFDIIYEPHKHNLMVIHQDALPLDKIYDFLAEASLVIAGDTGVRNMAIGTYTPTLGIFFGLTPYKYWPRDPIHECIFKYDLSVPSVEEVYKSAVKHMEKLYAE